MMKKQQNPLKSYTIMKNKREDINEDEEMSVKSDVHTSFCVPRPLGGELMNRLKGAENKLRK